MVFMMSESFTSRQWAVGYCDVIPVFFIVVFSTALKKRYNSILY